MIVNKELVVSNRKKADIVVELRQKNFRPFPKVAKAKTAGENEDAEEDEPEEASGTSTDYDYLLGMPIWSLTREKVRLGYPHYVMTKFLSSCTFYIDREAAPAGRR